MAALVYAYLTISSAAVLQFESPYMYTKIFRKYFRSTWFPSTIFEKGRYPCRNVTPRHTCISKVRPRVH